MLASSLVWVGLPLPVVRPCLIFMAAKTEKYLNNGKMSNENIFFDVRLTQPIKEGLVSFIIP